MSGYAFSKKAVEACGVKVHHEFGPWFWVFHWKTLSFRQKRYVIVYYDDEEIGIDYELWRVS